MIRRPLAVSARTGKAVPASSAKGVQPQHQKLPQPLFEQPRPQVTEVELPQPQPHPHDEEPEQPQPHPHDEEPEHPQPQEESLLGAVRVTVPVQPRPSVMVSTLAPLHPQPEEEEPQPPQLLQAIG